MIVSKEQQKIKIAVIRRKFSKIITIVSGIDDGKTIEDVGREMKQKFACGGTVKDGNIELQGDHKSKVKDELVKLGFSPDTIDVE